MTYNMTFTNNITNVALALQGANDSANGLPAIFALVILFVAFFSILQKESSTRAWNASSFITAIIGGLFWFIGLIDWYVAIVPLIMLIGGIIAQAAMGE